MGINSIKPVKCPQCGGDVPLAYPSSLVNCPYCGTTLSISYKESAPSKKSNSEPDNPIEVIISEADSFVIEIRWIFIPSPIIMETQSKQTQSKQDFQRIDSEIQDYLFTLAAISHYTKKSMHIILRLPNSSKGLGRVGYRSLSYDKINWKSESRYDNTFSDKSDSENTLKNVAELKKIMKKKGFKISEYWVESDAFSPHIEYLGRNFFRKVYSREYHKSCFLEGTIVMEPISSGYENIKPHIERIQENKVVSTIVHSLSTLLSEEEKQIAENLNHVRAKRTITLKKDSIGIVSQPHQITYHSIGMSEISDLKIMESLAIVVVNEVLNLHNNWAISSILIDPRLDSMHVNVDLSYKYIAQKMYNKW